MLCGLIVSLKKFFCVLYGKYVYYEKKDFLFKRYPASPPPPTTCKQKSAVWTDEHTSLLDVFTHDKATSVPAMCKVSPGRADWQKKRLEKVMIVWNKARMCYNLYSYLFEILTIQLLIMTFFLIWLNINFAAFCCGWWLRHFLIRQWI